MRHVTVLLLPKSNKVQLCGPAGVMELKTDNPVEVGIAVLEQLTDNKIGQPHPYRRATDPAVIKE